MTGKSLDTKANRRARRAVRALVAERFDTQEQAAAAFGVKQGTLSDFLSGNRGAGPKLIKGIASVDPLAALGILGIDVSEGGSGGPAVVEVQPVVLRRWVALIQTELKKTDRDDSSESRGIAACFAHALGYRPEAIADAQRQPVPRPDLSVRAWLRRMRVVDEELRLEPASVAPPVRRRAK